MGLTYSFLLLWVGGGLALICMIALRTALRPYAVAVGAMGYGAVGFACVGFGIEPRVPLALAGALVGAALGYGLQRLGREPAGLPLDVH